MAYRNKTYICFDADNDMWAYAYLKGWKSNDNIDFNFYDAHDINNLWKNSNETTIKSKLRERMKSAKLLLVIVGEKTKNLYRFVRWEIELALELNIPIIVSYLNDSKQMDSSLCPPVLRKELALHIPFKKNAIKWAIDNWIENHNYQISQENKNAMVLSEKLYKELGI